MPVKKKQSIVSDPQVDYIPPNKPKQPQKQRKLTANHIAYNTLIDEGVKPTDACRTLGISTTTAFRARQSRNVWDSQKDSLLRSSVKTVRSFIKGEGVGLVDKPKCSTVLAASMAVLDREVPKVNLSQSINMNINLDHCPINLAELE